MDYNVYNYFIGNYAQKPATKYDTHKSSELRSVMKNITKMTQSSPIYLVRLSQAKQEYALNIKEAAISLSNITVNAFRGFHGQCLCTEEGGILR